MLTNTIRNILLGGLVGVGLSGCLGISSDRNNGIDALISADAAHRQNPRVVLPRGDEPRPDINGSGAYSEDTYNSEDSTDSYDSRDSSVEDLVKRDSKSNDKGYVDTGRSDPGISFDDGSSNDDGYDSNDTSIDTDSFEDILREDITSNDPGINYDDATDSSDSGVDSYDPGVSPDIPIEPKCYDPDDGKDYTRKTSVMANSNEGLDGQIYSHQTPQLFSDECCDNCITAPSETGQFVKEFYCEDGIAKSLDYECEHGCENGVCIEAPVNSCVDSDGGFNLYEKGIVKENISSGDYISVPDQCVVKQGKIKTNVSACGGQDCYVEEGACLIKEKVSCNDNNEYCQSCAGENCEVCYECGPDGLIEIITQAYVPEGNYVAPGRDYNHCPHGCEDGACKECVKQVSFPDLDGDGFGDRARGYISCNGIPAGYITTGGDCDDTNPIINPNGVELCNYVDDDCNNLVDEEFIPPIVFPNEGPEGCSGVYGQCAENGTWECTLDGRAVCSTDVGGSEDLSSLEICDGVDNDCDGLIDDDCLCLEGEIEKRECDLEGVCRGFQSRTCDTDGYWSSWSRCDLERLEFPGFYLNGLAMGENHLAVTSFERSEDIDEISVFIYNTEDLSLNRKFYLEGQDMDVHKISFSKNNVLISHRTANTFIDLQTGDTIDFDHIEPNDESLSGNCWKSQCLELDGTKAYCFTEDSSKIRVHDVATSTDEFIDFEEKTGRKVRFNCDSNFQVAKYNGSKLLAGVFMTDTSLMGPKHLFIYDGEQVRVVDENAGCFQHPLHFNGDSLVYNEPRQEFEEGVCMYGSPTIEELKKYNLSDGSTINLSELTGVYCGLGKGSDLSGLSKNLLVCPSPENEENPYQNSVKIIDIDTLDIGTIDGNGRYHVRISGTNILLDGDKLCRLKDDWAQETSCVDSDDTGYNPEDPDNKKVKGTIKGYSHYSFNKSDHNPTYHEDPIFIVAEDFCRAADNLQAGKLVERYCSGDDLATHIVTSCSDGHFCSDGACVECSDESCPSCYDADGGIDKLIPGTVTGFDENGIFVTRSDDCINLGGKEYAGGEVIAGPSAVKEYSCLDNVINSTQLDCEYGCNSGRCMDEEEAVDWVKQSPDLACGEIVKDEEFFNLGGNVAQYKGADNLNKDNPKIKFKDLSSSETIEQSVGLSENGAAFTLKSEGVTYWFESASDPSQDDYDIKLKEPCEE